MATSVMKFSRCAAETCQSGGSSCSSPLDMERGPLVQPTNSHKNCANWRENGGKSEHLNIVFPS